MFSASCGDVPVYDVSTAFNMADTDIDVEATISSKPIVIKYSLFIMNVYKWEILVQGGTVYVLE